MLIYQILSFSCWSWSFDPSQHSLWFFTLSSVLLASQLWHNTSSCSRTAPTVMHGSSAYPQPASTVPDDSNYWCYSAHVNVQHVRAVMDEPILQMMNICDEGTSSSNWKLRNWMFKYTNKSHALTKTGSPILYQAPFISEIQYRIFSSAYSISDNPYRVTHLA